MKKVGKVILIIVIMLAILFAFGYFGLKKLWKNILTAPMVPEKYIAQVTTGGEVEKNTWRPEAMKLAILKRIMQKMRISKKSKSGTLKNWRQAAKNILWLYL